MGCFAPGATVTLRSAPLQQIWRDHLLTGITQETDGYQDAIVVDLPLACAPITLSTFVALCRRALPEEIACASNASSRADACVDKVQPTKSCGSCPADRLIWKTF